MSKHCRNEILLQQLDDVQSLASYDYQQFWVERLDITDFLHAWLVSHIVDEDIKIGAFVRDKELSC